MVASASANHTIPPLPRTAAAIAPRFSVRASALRFRARRSQVAHPPRSCQSISSSSSPRPGSHFVMGRPTSDGRAPFQSVQRSAWRGPRAVASFPRKATPRALSAGSPPVHSIFERERLSRKRPKRRGFARKFRPGRRRRARRQRRAERRVELGHRARVLRRAHFASARPSSA